MSRLATGKRLKIFQSDRPFSSFQFAEDRFSDAAPIRRLLSIGRSRGGRTIITENVPPESAVADENAEIKTFHPDHRSPALIRISIWKKAFSSSAEIRKLRSRDCLGYAILKKDVVSSIGYSRWHVFEAVFQKYPHQHNYCPATNRFRFRLAERTFSVAGCLYAQQNQLNKACAQVALRSLCATYLGRPELTYREINALAASGDPNFNPKEGLSSEQIPRVLDGLGIPYFDVDYNSDSRLRSLLPYQKVVYSGVESCGGALLAFTLSGPSAPNCGHIIPCFGHTFNEDSWAPHAEVAYFKIGEQIRYVPSRAWMSSFIVHDDNFGSDLCIPNAFLDDANVGYAVELLPKGYAYSGMLAEIVSADYFYSILPALASGVVRNGWMKRLIHYVQQQRLILRTVAISKSDYLRNLEGAWDWDGIEEKRDSLKDLARIKPDHLWMVEVSVPEVFSTNKRKLGEIILDGEKRISDKIDGTSFVLARFPERYVFFDKINKDGQPAFLTTPSAFKSHLPLLERK